MDFSTEFVALRDKLLNGQDPLRLAERAGFRPNGGAAEPARPAKSSV
ncbi:MAG: hypothetical protein ACLT4C_05370 [Butyricicoccus sp.]